MKITSLRVLKVEKDAFYVNAAKLYSEILICSTLWNFTEGELCEHARMRLVPIISIISPKILLWGLLI